MKPRHDISVARVRDAWRQSAIPMLCEYVRIPNKSPAFDPEWAANGYMDRAAELLRNWIRAQPVRGLSCEIVRASGRTPLLYAEIAGDTPETILLYGHFDKQPECGRWREDLGPWSPVLRNGRLYGRGAADDGYAVCAALIAIGALQAQGLPHARCVILIEGCEESASRDLPFYIEMLGALIGEPSLVICLDAECANYDQLWCTTSLRGVVNGTLRVATQREGTHSGGAGGVVPAPFRVARQLLSRIECERSGELLLDSLNVAIPDDRVREAQAMAHLIGDASNRRSTLLPGVRLLHEDTVELLLNNTWRPALTVIGADGLPPIAGAGNVLLPDIALQLSVRIPPSVDSSLAAAAIKQVLERDSPYGAHVAFEVGTQASGWVAPRFEPWLAESVEYASQRFFGRSTGYMGAGGSIPFMSMLGARFPATQFLVTGVVGPEANAHGPNEFLEIATAMNVTLCVAAVIADHAARKHA